MYDPLLHEVIQVNARRIERVSFHNEIRTNPSSNITANVIDADGQVQAGRININSLVGDDTIISGGISASRDNSEASIGVNHNITENVNVSATGSTDGSTSVGVSASVNENVSTTAGVSQEPGRSPTISVGVNISCTIM